MVAKITSKILNCQDSLWRNSFDTGNKMFQNQNIADEFSFELTIRVRSELFDYYRQFQAHLMVRNNFEHSNYLKFLYQ